MKIRRTMAWAACLACLLASAGAASAQHIDQKLDKILNVLEKSNQRFENLEQRMDRLEQRVNGGGYVPPPPAASAPSYVAAPATPSSYAPSLYYRPPQHEADHGAIPPWPFAPLSTTEQRGMGNVIRQLQSGPPYRRLNATEAEALDNLFSRITSSR